MVSKQFSLSRGIREGCCLSPLLFVLVIEPLAIVIRSNSEMAEIKLDNIENKIGLFADDVVLFLTDLKQYIHTLFTLIGTYGSFSGYKVNAYF